MTQILAILFGQNRSHAALFLPIDFFCQTLMGFNTLIETRSNKDFLTEDFKMIIKESVLLELRLLKSSDLEKFYWTQIPMIWPI